MGYLAAHNVYEALVVLSAHRAVYGGIERVVGYAASHILQHLIVFGHYAIGYFIPNGSVQFGGCVALVYYQSHFGAKIRTNSRRINNLVLFFLSLWLFLVIPPFFNTHYAIFSLLNLSIISLLGVLIVSN
jgi:hypothetical protein